MSGILNLLLAGAAAVVKDAYFNLVTLLLNTTSTNGAQNNTFLDSSTNNFTITRNGNATQGTFTPFSQTGWGNYFKGSTDYLSIANNSALDLGTGDFTIEGWWFFTDTSNQALISKYSSNNGWVVQYQAGNLRLVLGLGGSDAVYSFSWTPVVNTWYHVAVTRSGTSGRAFINGTQIGSTTTVTTSNTASTNPLQIGLTNTTSEYTRGYNSNIRLTKGGALYTSAFTPSTVPLTTTVSAGTVSLLTAQNNRFLDNSSNAFAITVNGTPSVQAFEPFEPGSAYSTSVVGGSGYFDGSGDFLSIPDNTAFNLSSGSWTIEAWVYPTTVSTRQVIIGKRGASNPFTISWYLEITATGALQFTNNNGANTSSASVIKANQWGHCAASYDGTNLSMYYNGARVFGPTAVTCVDSAASIYIGGSTIDSFYLNGYANGVRVVKGTAVYSGATITVPTAPFTAISGTSLLTNFTNAGIYDSAAKNDLETVGNAQVSTTQAKWGTTSMYFDGTGDNLVIPSNPNVWLGSGAFSIEMWLYPNNASSEQMLLCGNDTGSLFLGMNIDGANRIALGRKGVAVDNFVSYTYSTGAWIYLAVTRDTSNNIKFFVNGSQVGSTGTNSNSFTNSVMNIGFEPTQKYLNGYIDDLRITKGLARTITASPTAAFPIQ